MGLHGEGRCQQAPRRPVNRIYLSLCTWVYKSLKLDRWLHGIRRKGHSAAFGQQQTEPVQGSRLHGSLPFRANNGLLLAADFPEWTPLG